MPIGYRDFRTFQTKTAVYYSNQQYIGLNEVSWMDLLDNLLIWKDNAVMKKNKALYQLDLTLKLAQNVILEIDLRSCLRL